jgi:hypothetical protein
MTGQTADAFNPLNRLSIEQDELNEIFVEEFEKQNCQTLPEKRQTFDCLGVYCLYYFGDHRFYEPISNEKWDCEIPIYVGKGVPQGSRKGNLDLESSSGRRVYERLRKHHRAITRVENLDISDFRCRYLILSREWVEYVERLLVSNYLPWWNRYVDGFGINDPGEGRDTQKESVWDALHPGRRFVDKLELPPHGSKEEVWEKEVQPKIEAEWSLDRVGKLSTTESGGNQQSGLGAFVD